MRAAAPRFVKPRRAGALASVVLLAVALGAAAAQPAQPLRPGDHYVAMGSSFAAGPAIANPAPDAPARCGRSADNYAAQLARRLSLRLTDVSCGGARTVHLLGAWDELPPQLDALWSRTRLVTITIGGNDLGYMGALFRASCRGQDGPPRDPQRPCGPFGDPGEAAYADVRANLQRIAAEVRRRAPQARLVFVDYASIVPPAGNCAAVPLAADDAAAARALAARLARITAEVARAAGAEVLAASAVTADHHACAREPWMNGHVAPVTPGAGAPYHPNLAGMTAVADALQALLADR